jgi:adenylate cyclase
LASKYESWEGKEEMRKILVSPWTALLTLALVLGIRIADPTFVESVRLRYFDTLITAKEPTDNNVYTVNIDEAALDKYGQWPLPRNQYAKIVKDLYDRGAGLVVLNVLMAEPDRTGGDTALAQALKQYPVILGSVPSGKTKNTPRNPGSAVLGPEHLDQIITYPGLIANIPSLENAAAGIGIVNTLPEVDGVNRRIPLIATIDGKLYPSLAMETLRVAADDTTFQVKLNENGVEKMRIPKFGPVTTDNFGRIWIDWSQQTKSISLTDLPKSFKGAIVIVGPTAAGIGNPVPTAIGAVWPHNVQAAVVGTMANGVVIQRPDYADGLEIIAILVAGLVLLFLTRWVYVGLASVIALVALGAYGSHFVFVNHLWLFDVTAPTAGIILVALHAYGVKFVSEFLQKQQIKKQFGSYVNPTIVERLQKDPSLIKLGGERKELSIVMTDLRGFTTLGESFGDDVEGLTQIMNDYMTALSIPVLANDGTLIKFIGDASLHVHGAPLDDPRHAYTAVKTAQAMIKAIEEFNKELTAKGKPPVGMGAGVNTGETLIGNIGAKSKFGYDVLGDSVSTAARLEGQTKSYGVLLIIGPNTNEIVKDEIFTLELDNIAVKGKTVGLRIYTPLECGDAGAMAEYILARETHDEMMASYRAQQFDRAIEMCEELMGEFDGQMDHSYELWIERCKEMKARNLPKDWDGIYRATSK